MANNFQVPGHQQTQQRQSSGFICIGTVNEVLMILIFSKMITTDPPQLACEFEITSPDSKVGWANVGPTSVLSSWRWANIGPTYIAVWEGCLWSERLIVALLHAISRHTTPWYYKIPLCLLHKITTSPECPVLCYQFASELKSMFTQSTQAGLLQIMVREWNNIGMNNGLLWGGGNSSSVCQFLR